MSRQVYIFKEIILILFLLFPFSLLDSSIVVKISTLEVPLWFLLDFPPAVLRSSLEVPLFFLLDFRLPVLFRFSISESLSGLEVVWKYKECSIFNYKHYNKWNFVRKIITRHDLCKVGVGDFSLFPLLHLVLPSHVPTLTPPPYSRLKPWGWFYTLH